MMRRMLVEDVAFLSELWHFPGPIAQELGRDDPAIVADALVHELAHAAVLDLRPTPLWRLSATIGSCFMNYGSPYAADMSEMRALAVERLVFEAMEWPIRFEEIVRLAIADLRYLDGVRAHDALESLAAHPLTDARAARVIRWLKTLCAMDAEQHRAEIESHEKAIATARRYLFVPRRTPSPVRAHDERRQERRVR